MLFLGLSDLRSSWPISEQDTFVHRQKFTRDPRMCDQLGGQRQVSLTFWPPPPAAPVISQGHRSVCMAEPPLKAVRASKALFWFGNGFAVRISMSRSELQMLGLHLTQMSG